MICGNDPRIPKALDLPNEQMIVKPWVSYREWPSVLSHFDIGLAPLAGEYDDRRSWIKVLEYLVMRIPWVASAGSPYEEFSSYGWIVKNNSQAWERVLLDIVDNIVRYREQAKREAYLAGISQAVDDNVYKILNTFASIYQDALGKPLSVMVS
jgi:hypothetical protein